MKTLQDMLIKEIKFSDMPSYFRLTNIPRAAFHNTFIYCGEVQRGGNEPYCYVEEKQCSGHICRVIAPGRVYGEATVIRDDSTVWHIFFDPFVEVYKIKVVEG